VSLKQLVNNPEIWTSFIIEVDDQIKSVQKQMSQLDEPKDLYRCQGELRRLNSLKKLRERVNNG
jgi:hypothetical protein